MDATRQWGRYCEVLVGKRLPGQAFAVGERIFSSLTEPGPRISFNVKKTIRHPPNIGSILLYNLSPNVEQAIVSEFDNVILTVGYLGSPRVVFQGNIKPGHAIAYWDSGDRIVEIHAADGDKDYHDTVVNETIAAGSVPRDEVNAVLRAYKANGGTVEGFIETGSKSRTRGKVLTGSASAILHRVADDNDAHWSIQDGALQIVQSTGVLPSEAIVINEGTGLVEAPQLSDKGVTVKCQLNPQIHINGVVKLDNDNFKVQITQSLTGGAKAKPDKLARRSPDGVYKVYTLNHVGDTRGPDWHTISEVIGIGQAIPSKGGKKSKALSLGAPTQ